MSERKPGPFDDLFGGSGGSQPPHRPEPQEPPASPPPGEPESRREPPPDPFGGSATQPPRQAQPVWGNEPAPNRDPRPIPPAPDPFSTAPVGPQAGVRPPRAENWSNQARTASTRRRSGRDPIPYIIGGVVFILALLVFALFLPPFNLLGDDDGGEATIASVCDGVGFDITDEIPATPPNLEPVSPLRELSAETQPCGPLDITLNLTAVTMDANGLGFYTYSDGSYRKVSDAALTPDGRAVQGRLEILPENVVVIRSTGDIAQVEGFLAAGATVDPSGLPVLDAVNPVSYSPVADGTLAGTAPVADAETVVIPVARADSSEETAAVDTLLQNQVTTDTHVAALAAQVVDNNLAGIELDYGCVDPGLRANFTNMVTNLNNQVGEGKRVSIVVPSPEGGAACENFGAYDLQALGDVADFIKLYPIRDQTVYRPRMIELLTAALATGVPRQKLLLIVSPNSTFIGPDGARQLISEQGALEQAAIPSLADGEQPLPPGSAATFIGRRVDPGSGATGIAWSPEDLAVKFSYQDGEATFTYWIENAFSLAFKLDLVARFQLGGVAVEDASSDAALADVWTPISDYVAAGAPTLVEPNPAAFALEWRVDGTIAEGETAPTFLWQAVPQLGGQCSFGLATAADHCVTLVVGDGTMRVGGELPVAVDAGGETDGDEVEDGADETDDGTATATPTSTP